MFQVHHDDDDNDHDINIKCDTVRYDSTIRRDRLGTTINLTDHCNTSPSSSSSSSSSSHDQNMKSLKPPTTGSSSLLSSTSSSSLLSSNSLDCNHPNFIKNYFLTSRLHHISTWKMDLTDYVMNAMKELSASSSSSLSMATKLSSVTSASSSLSSYFFSHNNNNNSSSKHPLHDHRTTNNRSSFKYKYQPSNIDDQYRTIMHIDMDCFFASVGIRDRPHLINTPIAVAHSLNGVNMSYSTSEIASCNYIARSKGVKNGMFIGHAKQLEPNLHIIPYEFEKYDHVSKCLYSVLLRHSNYVQAVSCDEAFIDVTYIVQSKLKGIVNGYGISNTHLKKNHRGSKYNEEEEEEEEDEENDEGVGGGEHAIAIRSNNGYNHDSHSHVSTYHHRRLQESYEEVILSIAKEIKENVYKSTGCNASIGISHNILLARLATSRAKPNGISSMVGSYDIMQYLHSLPISKLPGIGSSISEKCSSLHIDVCSDLLKEVDKKVLQHTIGSKTVDMLVSYAQGIDQRVLENRPRQSMGAEINWGIRFSDQSQVMEFLKNFCMEVFARLKQSHYIAKHVILTVKKRLYNGEPGKYLGCGHCEDISRSLTCSNGRSIDSSDVLYYCVNGLYSEINKAGIQANELRGVGIHLKQLSAVATTTTTTSSTTTSVDPPFVMKGRCLFQHDLKSTINFTKDNKDHDDDDDDNNSNKNVHNFHEFHRFETINTRSPSLRIQSSSSSSSSSSSPLPLSFTTLRCSSNNDREYHSLFLSDDISEDMMPAVVVPHTLDRNESAVKLYPKSIDSSSAAIHMIDDNHDSDDTLMKASSESAMTSTVESFHNPSMNVMMKEEIDGDTCTSSNSNSILNNNNNNNSSSTSMESPCIDHQANIQSLPTAIDQSVFYALPISIQNEILDSISNHRQSSMCMSPSVRADVDGRDFDFQFIHKNNKRILSTAHSPLPKKHRKAVASTPSCKASNRKVINAVIVAKGHDNKQSKLSNWLISSNDNSSSSSSHLKS